MKKKTFGVISLGCPRNLVDSETIVSEFKKKGYFFKEDILGVDTVVINTCAFIEDAKKESIDTILKAIDAKKDGNVKRIIVAGCLSERYPKELRKELSEIDEFRGVTDFNTTERKVPGSTLTPKHYSYVKISEGCKNRCTYCIIPYLKGPYRSKKLGTVMREAESCIKQGAKEVNLIGQDTSLYGIDLYKKKKLGELLRKINRISKNNWIRLLYCHPANLDQEVLNIIRDSSNICKYIDLPIEHISDRILKKMGRKTTKNNTISLINRIRKTIPDVAIRTSVIVGFPGETAKDFKELVSFIEDIKFERLGLFRYSKEEGTPAFNFKGHISEKEKDRRFDRIMSMQRNIAEEINEKFKDRIMNILVEEKKDDYYIGRTEYDAPEVDGVVYVKSKNLKIGTFQKVKITDTYEYDLVGQL